VCVPLALLASLSSAAVAQGPDAVDAPRISMHDFKKLFAAKNVVIVETRNADEFARSHIPGSGRSPEHLALVRSRYFCASALISRY
jgi:hypothetical protein